MSRVALRGMRLLGVLAALYIGGLSAGNLHNAWNGGGATPGSHYTNWPELAYLIGGIALAGSFFYWVLGGTTVRSTSARLGLGVIALVAWVVSVALMPHPV
jgi:hypothetical protein